MSGADHWSDYVTADGHEGVHLLHAGAFHGPVPWDRKGDEGTEFSIDDVDQGVRGSDVATRGGGVSRTADEEVLRIFAGGAEVLNDIGSKQATETTHAGVVNPAFEVTGLKIKRKESFGFFAGTGGTNRKVTTAVGGGCTQPFSFEVRVDSVAGDLVQSSGVKLGQ